MILEIKRDIYGIVWRSNYIGILFLVPLMYYVYARLYETYYWVTKYHFSPGNRYRNVILDEMKGKQNVLFNLQ